MEHNLLRTLADNTLDLIYVKDRCLRFTFLNAALVRMIGVISVEEVIGKTDFDFNPPEIAQQYADDDLWVMESGQALVDREELLTSTATGESRWHSTTKVPLRDDTGEIVGLMGITRDIDARKRAEQAVRQLNADLERRVAERTGELLAMTETLTNERNLMRALVDSAPDYIYAKDRQSKFLLANREVARAMGVTPEALLGKTDFEFYPEQMARGYYEDEQRVLRTGQPVLNREESVLDLQSGKTRWLLTSKFPVRDAHGNIIGLVGIGRDVTERKATEERIKYLATHDSLTDLPNRIMFTEVLAHALETARRHSRQLAVMFIDLDGFKTINDSLGHEAGDQLLRALSKRLKSTLRACDLVARLGGDEFVLLVQDVTDAEQIAVVAQKLLAAATEPVALDGQMCCVTASIGVGLYPQHGQSDKELMRSADLAMYAAKARGKNCYEFYSEA